jgi:RNA polymerase sigma-70 factor (ECF subfamily)
MGMQMSGERPDWFEQLELLQRGDLAALATLRRLVTGHLIRLGAVQLRDSWEDVAQEVLLKLWRAYQKREIADPRAFVAFAGVITRNTLIDWGRRQQRVRPGEEDPVQPWAHGQADAGLDPATRLGLEKALAELPERHREVIEEIYLKGRSYEETAQSLRRPRGTVNRLQREGVQMLRRILGIRVPGRDIDPDRTPP